MASIIRLIALCAVLAASVANAASPCAASPGCELPSGRYLALAPSSWDGRTPLPALVFFHGWRESAEYVVADAPIRAFAERHKVLVIAPHGEGNTWSYPGAPGRHRDEFAFAAELARDVKARFAVDPKRFVAAGFSQGASMIWNIACRQPGLFSAYAALAGGFWEPSPAACSGEGVDLIHVHGLNDATVPIGGRSLRGGAFRQSDIRRDWRIWLDENGCSARPSGVDVLAGRSCQVWRGCAKPQALSLCTHESGHEIHDSDLEVVWSFVEKQALSR